MSVREIVTGNMVVEASILERDGCPIRYWLQGAEGRPLIVLTHGATLDHHMFDAQLPALVNEYRILTWDMRGHGESRPIGKSFSVPGAAEDLLAILDRIGVEQATFIGQSTGGYVIQELVFRHPQRVQALVMIDCTCITLNISPMERLTLRLTAPMFHLYPYDLLKKQIANSSSIKDDVRDYILKAVSTIPKTDFINIWSGIADCLHYEPGYYIEQPLLLVRGEQDKLGNIAKVAPIWAARDPQSKYEAIPNAGHCSNQDNPDFFNRQLLDFLHRYVPAKS